MSEARFAPVEGTKEWRAALRVAHAAFGARGVEAYSTARRMRSERYHGARWWLGRDDAGEVVTSLICYDLAFALPGEDPVAGFGLGVVGTVEARRGAGLASGLCRRVIADARARDRSVGLLFSAIPPAMYARLDFRVAPAHGWCCNDPAALARSGPASELVPVNPYGELAALDRRYHAAHGGLYLWRDEAIWRRSLATNADDVFFAVGSLDRGYVRLVDGEGEIEVVELCLSDPDDEPGVLRAVARITAELGRERLVGWLDPTPTVTTFFVARTRDRTLPMVWGEVPVEESRFWASDYF